MSENSEAVSNEVVAFLKSEAEKNEKAARATWMFGGLIVLVIAGYMTWMVQNVRSLILDPEDLAAVIVTSLDDNLPGMMEDAESYLASQAPVLANGLKTELVRVMASSRKGVQGEIDSIYRMIPDMSGQLADMVRGKGAEFSSDIRQMVKSHEDNEKFAEHVVDAIMSDLGQFVDEEFVGLGGQRGVGTLKADSLESLKRVNSSLVNLVNKRPSSLSRSEQLQRRLLVSWVHIMDRHLPKPKRGDEPSRIVGISHQVK